MPVVSYAGWPTQDLMAEIGSRLRRERLNRNQTQADLVKAAGISVDTLKALERGSNATLRVLLLVLRALGLLDRIDALVPDPGPSPVQAAKLRGRQRQRASRKTLERPPSDTAWEWGE